MRAAEVTGWILTRSSSVQLEADLNTRGRQGKPVNGWKKGLAGSSSHSRKGDEVEKASPEWLKVQWVMLRVVCKIRVASLRLGFSL